VKKGDTMLGIAFRYGITLDQLQAANPKVNPRILSVGTVLVIPVRSVATEGVVLTPAPFPAKLGAMRCFPVDSEGVWCLGAVTNDQGQAMENISVWLTLYSPDGQALASQPAIPPLNLLLPGRSLPVMAFFPLARPGNGTASPVAPPPAGTPPRKLTVTPALSPALPANASATFNLPLEQLPHVTAQAQLLSALGVAANDPRYLDASAQVSQQTVDASGIQARLQGLVSLPAGSPAARTVWIVVVAYGENGEMVGLRKWEAPTKLSPGTSLPFDVTVYSLGPAIQKTDVLVEARP
jgi:LysM repeat protein